MKMRYLRRGHIKSKIVKYKKETVILRVALWGCFR